MKKKPYIEDSPSTTVKIYFNDAIATSIGHAIGYYACVWLADYWSGFIMVAKILLGAGILVCVIKLLMVMYSFITAIDFRAKGKVWREFGLALIVGILIVVPGVVAGYFFLQLYTQ